MGEEGHEAEDWMQMALTAADNLVLIVTVRLAPAISYTEAARMKLAEAAGVLREANDATDILYSDVLALVPAGSDPLLQASANAAAKLVAGMFAGPLPGRIDAAGDLLASVFAFPPPVAGPLLDARRDLRLFDDKHAETGHQFGRCAPHLGLQPGAASLRLLSRHHDFTAVRAKQAKLRLDAAMWKSVAAEDALRLCLEEVQSPRRGERVTEAEENLRHAIGELDAALVALRRMRAVVALEEQIVRDAIDHVTSATLHEAGTGSSRPG